MTHMKHTPPYKDPSEAIQYVKDNYISPIDSSSPSWREVAIAISARMRGKTSKGEVWNVAHNKYKCPPGIAAALRKMNLLDDKRYGFFFRVSNKEEYERVKLWLGERSFADWVRGQADFDNGGADESRPGRETA